MPTIIKSRNNCLLFPGNKAIRVPLMACVEKTQAVAKAMADRDWNLAVELRGKSFARNLVSECFIS